ncbi:hypothetical protein N7517_008016 [Penicillium concentricum]|uniref:Fatty acyl-CoA reductase n=1 Tax=Penicillium concentricum TaxID=293559 RepID=A0A9W9RT26_9EURO|nr:uncharacterized protein N7517_008016 [Penicillium concentricum]KAJ5365130.1 hypothetical protein N7517_008016 [Penicillium concentricum]
MWDYYNDKTIFITGGTGFLGTAIVYRLLTQTSVCRVYMLCRGGIGKLRLKWTESLSLATVEKLLSTNRITAINGDILSPDLGLSQDELSTLRQEVNVIIHSASSINLGKPLGALSDVIIRASERMVDIALTCPSLDRFVYISTAYCNSHLFPTNEDIEVEIKEDIYDPSHHSNVMKEWAQVKESGSSDAYEAHDFPWSYGYAKNLTERILLHRFTQSDVKDKLLIMRPSVIGPAQSFPDFKYNVPLSSPLTKIAAIIALSPAGMVTAAIKAVEKSSQVFIDEVPVDVVVDRLLAHLAVGTNGCVHAVSGQRERHKFIKWWESVASIRRLPGKFDLNWKELDWKSYEQHPLPRFYVIFGTSFGFREDKTVALSRHPLVESCKELQLFTNVNLGGQLLSRTEDVYSMMNHIAKNDAPARAIIELYYQDVIKAKL